MEKTIRIIKDNWIQSTTTIKYVVHLPENLKVRSLIDEVVGRWNEDIVRSYFSEDDAEKILQIPLCYTSCEDFPSWPHTKSGIYTVKSAYSLKRLESLHHLLSENGRDEPLDQHEMSKLWKRLWAIKAPPKMKIILWRMAHDCLPTGPQLKYRHIPASDAGCFCGREETVEHAILMCQYASEVCHQVKKCFDINWKPHAFIHIKQCLFVFLDRAKDDEATTFTITVWHIWEARNAVGNGEKMLHPHSIAERTKAYIEMVLMQSIKESTPTGVSLIAWPLNGLHRQMAG